MKKTYDEIWTKCKYCKLPIKRPKEFCCIGCEELFNEVKKK